MRSPAKRAFLRGRFNQTTSMRPLGALPAMDFEDACTRCGACAKACAEALIVIDREGFPAVDLLRGECTFCNACTEACDAGALISGLPWSWRASIDANCLSTKGTSCRACQDHCPAQAIRFQLRPGGHADPAIDLTECTGCGACAAPCPVNAIQFTQNSQPAEASPC